MNYKPQIILFSPTIHTGGGTERVLVNLGNELKVRGFNITIAVNVLGDNPIYPIHSTINIKQFWFGNIRSKYPTSLILKIFNKLFGIYILEFFLRRIIPSKNILIISFSNGITLDCYKTNYGKKLIAFEHWPFWITEKHPKLQPKIKSVYPRLKKVIVLTQHEKNVYNAMNCMNVEIIPNAYSFLPKEPAKLNNKIVLSIGHFNEQKRRDLLIQAWKLVIEKHPDWKLVIIGDGHQKLETIKLIQELNLTKTVDIKNPTSQIIDQYLNASIYVKSSEYEALPMVLIEAKICGLACISFDVISGPAEIINEGKDGFLIPFPKTKEMAEKINLLIENELLRKNFGSYARQDALIRYNPEKIYTIWQNFLMEVSSLKYE